MAAQYEFWVLWTIGRGRDRAPANTVLDHLGDLILLIYEVHTIVNWRVNHGYGGKAAENLLAGARVHETLELRSKSSSIL